ncbi:MAG: glycosyltransferase family 2 protein [Propionibacteriaceae bacterium]|nr:glycosyltransferase family 2 protein [Propionibacteriaceae bacterium]
MITVVMPVFNEAEQIFANVCVVRDLLESRAIEHQILLVDDGSRDQTWDEISRLCETYSNISALRFSRNFGKESAICAALERCTGDAVIIMDADLQHPPELMVEMERLWREEGYDVVEGVKADRGKESVATKLSAGLFYGLFKKMTDIDIGVASDFKLLDRKVIDAWRKLPERDTFFRGMSAWLGFRRIQIPFTVQQRTTGRSKWTPRSLTGLAVNAITAYTSAPLYVVAFLGIALMVFAFVLLVQTLIMKFLGGASTGFTTVIIIQLLIGSCVMLSLGIIGIYLARIYEETKRRPRYVISDMQRQALLDS